MNDFISFLFGTEFSNLTEGTWRLDWSWPMYILGVLVLAAVAYGLFGHFRIARDSSNRHLAIWLVRSALCAAILLVLLRPQINVDVEEPVAGRVLILADNSSSMTLGSDDNSRGQQIKDLFAKNGALSNLGDRFDLTLKAIGSGTTAVDDITTLDFSAKESRITDALAQAAVADRASSISSIVLITDGGDSSASPLNSVIDSLDAAGISVHTIGVGDRRFGSDLEITDISMPRRILAGDQTSISTRLTSSHDTARNVTLIVEAGGAVVAERALTVEANTSTTISTPVTLPDTGRHTLRVSIDVDGDGAADRILSNNTAIRTIDVSDRPVDVLHFEGEPRFEVKFLRRALKTEKFVRLRSLIRTAENKYYRLGIRDSEELANGFPDEAEKLFAWDVVIVGSANAELMDTKRQEVLRDFVAERGGGLLMLGSANSFAEGGFSNSTLAQMLPVELADRASVFREEVAVRPNGSEATHPLAQLNQTDNDAMWERLPRLTVVNPLRKAKPGAAVVLEADSADGTPLIVLALHRYGRGTVAVLAVRDSWRWQINPDIEADDLTHETLMRQLVRWLARPVPTRLDLQIAPAVAAPGSTVNVTVSKRDAVFRNDESTDNPVEITLTTAAGDVRTLTPVPATDTPGQLNASFVVNEPGRYDVKAVTADDSPLQTHGHVDVAPDGREFISPGQKEAWLKRLSDRTGGRYFDLNDLNSLADTIDAKRNTHLVNRTIELWRAPVFLLLIIFLAALEWLLRRRRSLA